MYFAALKKTLQSCVTQWQPFGTPTLPSVTESPTTTSETSATTLITIGLKLTLASTTLYALKTLLQTAILRARLKNEKTNERAPGPPPNPIIGNLLALRKNYYKTLYAYVEEPISIFWVLTTPFVIINDPVTLRRVLSGAGNYKKPRYLGYRSRTLNSAVQAESARVADESIAYAPNGDASRKGVEVLVRSNFPKIVHEMKTLLDEMAHQDANADWSVGLQAVRRGVVRLNLGVLFGAHVGEAGENADAIASAIGNAGVEFARRMVNPLKVFVDMRSNLQFARNVSALIALGRRLCKQLDVQAGLENVPTGVKWVHAWIGKVGVIGKLGKVLGLLMASTQTVPLTMVWLLHIVASDDSVYRKLQKELLENGVHSAENLTYDVMDQLHYAEAVVQETLRLYPPFPLMQRQAQQDDVISHVRVPAGTIVYIVPWLIHRNERFWKDAHAFRPERFLDSGYKREGFEWVYLPFGRGSRMCAGSRLALMELKVLLVQAVLDFQWTSERALAAGEDARFPDLGMMPRDVTIDMQRVRG